MAARTIGLGDDRPPGRESAATLRKQRGQFRTVPLDDALHAVVGHPVHAERRVDLGPEVDVEEAIALQPPRGHQDENAEGGVAEAKAFRRRFAEQSDHRVDQIDVLVDILQQADVLGIGGEILPPAYARLVQGGAEIVVARHPPTASPHQVGDRHIDDLAVALELRQRIGEIVQGDGARIGHAERIHDILQPLLAHEVVGLSALDVEERPVTEFLPGGAVVEAVVVRDQRMHPVDGDEILGQAIRGAGMIRRGLRNPRQGVAVDQPQSGPRQPVVRRRTIPVAVHPHFQGLGPEDSRGPLDGVDLGDEGGHDQPGGLEDPLVAPVPIGRAQFVADHVVLAREQKVHCREAEPPVLVEPGDFETIDVGRQIAVRRGGSWGLREAFWSWSGRRHRAARRPTSGSRCS